MAAAAHLDRGLRGESPVAPLSYVTRLQVGAPHRIERLVYSGRSAVPDQPFRASAIHSQILSWRAVPSRARDLAAHPASMEAANSAQRVERTSSNGSRHTLRSCVGARLPACA